jgi:hypothetical protein
MIVFGQAHLRRILGAYAAYCNESRTHRSLNKDAPFHRAIERLGAITSYPVLGGLHHHIAESNFRYTQLADAIAEFTQYLQNKGLNARDLIGVAADQRRSFMEMPRMPGNWRNYVPADCLGPEGTS